jgi:hypothetical protein
LRFVVAVLLPVQIPFACCPCFFFELTPVRLSNRNRKVPAIKDYQITRPCHSAYLTPQLIALIHMRIALGVKPAPQTRDQRSNRGEPAGGIYKRSEEES